MPTRPREYKGTIYGRQLRSNLHNLQTQVQDLTVPIPAGLSNRSRVGATITPRLIMDINGAKHKGAMQGRVRQKAGERSRRGRKGRVAQLGPEARKEREGARRSNKGPEGKRSSNKRGQGTQGEEGEGGKE